MGFKPETNKGTSRLRALNNLNSEFLVYRPMKILFLIGEEFEDLEFFYPYYRAKEEGYTTAVAWKERGKVTGKHGYTVESDISFREVDPTQYDFLVIPGGKGPSHIREDEEVKRIAKAFFDENKPIGSICHGPQILISAGLVKGRRMTSFVSVKAELTTAGAQYEDREVVIDDNLISSRHPGDLPFFSKAILKEIRIREGKHIS